MPANWSPDRKGDACARRVFKSRRALMGFLDLQALAGLRLDHFYFRISFADIRFEPIARVGFAMAEQHCSRFDTANHVEQIIAIGMRGEIKFADFTEASYFSPACTEEKCLALGRGF